MNHLHQKISILFLLTFYFSQVKAQVSTFELDDYKLTDVRIQSFTNTFRFIQNGQANKNILDDQSTYRNNNINSWYTGSFNVYSNTRPYQRNTTVSTFFSGHRSVQEFGSQTAQNRNLQKSYDWNSGLEISDIHRKYFNPKLFFEAQFLGRYSFDQSFNYRETQTPTPEFERVGIDRHTISMGLPVKIGLGRLERVEDARQAIFLMQELQRVGRLRDSVSQEDYLNLSALVSRLRNRRFFDIRLQRIYQVKAIDTFLQQNNLTTEIDGPYFTTAYDYWMFGGGPVRQSGNRIAFAFYPMMAKESTKDARVGSNVALKSNFKNEYYQGFFALEWDRERPINQKWQSSFMSRLFFGKRVNNLITEYVLSEFENQFDLSGIQFQSSYGIGFYPNTRTAVTWQAGVDLSRTNKVTTDGNLVTIGNYDFEMDRIMFYSTLSAEYYVSPRFRIFANVNLQVLRIPSIGQEFTQRGFELWYRPEVYVADSYFEPNQLINPNGTYYTEESRTTTYANIRVLYSLF